MENRINTWHKTETQIQRAASAKIKKYVSAHQNKHLQYYFVRGMFHINNIGSFENAKTICEEATGLKFKHFTNSICKIDFEAEEERKKILQAIFDDDEANFKLL